VIGGYRCFLEKERSSLLSPGWF